VTEAADYPDLTGHSYTSIREELIDPIEEAYSLCLLVSVAIANYFGGHG
jgi:phosphoenolpyruvate carboxylase